MIVAMTGHRPEKLPDTEWVLKTLIHEFESLSITKVIQGCASGTDLISAYAAHCLEIPYVAAKPWENHKGRMGGSSGFKNTDAKVYDLMIENASEIVNVTGEIDFPGNWAYFKRNEWMVDNAEFVVAVWDGSKSGTRHTVEYAQRQRKPVYRIDPMTKTVVGWID